MANGDGYEGSGRHTFAEGDNGRTISCEAKVATFTYAVIDSASLEVVGELPVIVPSPQSRYVPLICLNLLLPSIRIVNWLGGDKNRNSQLGEP